MFHTNSIEGLWSKIKRLTNDFSDISLKVISNLEKRGENIKNYLDAWIVYALFLRDIEKLNLSTLDSQKYLCDIFKIN